MGFEARGYRSRGDGKAPRFTKTGSSGCRSGPLYSGLKKPVAEMLENYEDSPR